MTRFSTASQTTTTRWCAGSARCTPPRRATRIGTSSSRASWRASPTSSWDGGRSSIAGFVRRSPRPRCCCSPPAWRCSARIRPRRTSRSTTCCRRHPYQYRRPSGRRWTGRSGRANPLPVRLFYPGALMQRSKQQALMFLLGAVLVGGALGFSADRYLGHEKIVVAVRTAHASSTTSWVCRSSSAPRSTRSPSSRIAR